MKATSAEQKKEALILMRKVHYAINADWEFARFLAYVKSRADLLIDAGTQVQREDAIQKREAALKAAQLKKQKPATTKQKLKKDLFDD